MPQLPSFVRALVSVLAGASALAAAEPAVANFEREIRPLLVKYCYDCHGDTHDKGGVAFDKISGAAGLQDHKLWLRVLKNIRSGVMPPQGAAEPLPAAVAEQLMAWIKRDAFALDPARPDPGRVTVRRLNRTEYRNTVRDLTGVDFDAHKEFPADDTGHGFDHIGDVLSVSPLLLEKYLDAAQSIIAQTVPMQPRVVAETLVPGVKFATEKIDTALPELPKPAAIDPPLTPLATATAATAEKGFRRGGTRGPPAPPPMQRPAPNAVGDTLELSYYTPVTVAATHPITQAGRYQVVLELRAFERYVDNVFDQNKCRLHFSIDGEQVLEREFVREGGKKFEFPFERTLAAGEHTFTVEIIPDAPQPQVRALRLRLEGVTLRGPLDEKSWVRPKGYAKIFPRDPPAEAAVRRAYARELLGPFASRAFRRPIDAASLERLVDLAESVYAQPGNHFEAGVAQAMVAVLASPRFLFREEEALPLAPSEAHPRIDEFALASRLSYFLWSSMPDAELARLAGAGRLRAELPAQLRRMLADRRAAEFTRNFTGQWLQARDILTVPLTANDIFLRDHPNPAYEAARATFAQLAGKSRDQRTPEENERMNAARAAFGEFNRLPKPQLTESLRRAMQEETELTFAHIVREDRSVLELIRSDYTFLNEELARHYGIAGVTGRELRRVQLAPGSPRGGVLTQGSVLAVTSNPTRTSPVKRGVFILDHILGAPPPPPPPNIPSLEDAAPAGQLKQLGPREVLALHAKDPACASCHLRMDPLGLALENFNALGVWRERELGQPVEPAGQLFTGEKFRDVRELKDVLVTARRRDFYHCLAEKLLTYALGRGIEHHDVTTLDRLVADLEATGGKPSALINGIVNSAAFQQRRRVNPAALVDAPLSDRPALVQSNPRSP
jgi:cytochrome c553